MAKKKYYAVKEGRVPGIYNSWDECTAQVNGYSGAIYKSFSSIEEAEIFIGSLPRTSDEPKSNMAQNIIFDRSISDECKIYVDGSYNSKTNIFSYGMVIIRNGKEITSNRSFFEPEMAQMRNVAGEIMGATAAMEYCLENNISECSLFYDYEGIEKWPLREWKANRIGTKNYVDFYDSVKDEVKIKFIHVKGHSGDKYNEMADRLAKAAAGI